MCYNLASECFLEDLSNARSALRQPVCLVIAREHGTHPHNFMTTPYISGQTSVPECLTKMCPSLWQIANDVPVIILDPDCTLKCMVVGPRWYCNECWWLQQLLQLQQIQRSPNTYHLYLQTSKLILLSTKSKLSLLSACESMFLQLW